MANEKTATLHINIPDSEIEAAVAKYNAMLSRMQNTQIRQPNGQFSGSMGMSFGSGGTVSGGEMGGGGGGSAGVVPQTQPKNLEQMALSMGARAFGMSSEAFGSAAIGAGAGVAAAGIAFRAGENMAQIAQGMGNMSSGTPYMHDIGIAQTMHGLQSLPVIGGMVRNAEGMGNALGLWQTADQKLSGTEALISSQLGGIMAGQRGYGAQQAALQYQIDKSEIGLQKLKTDNNYHYITKKPGLLGGDQSFEYELTNAAKAQIQDQKNAIKEMDTNEAMNKIMISQTSGGAYATNIGTFMGGTMGGIASNVNSFSAAISRANVEKNPGLASALQDQMQANTLRYLIGGTGQGTEMNAGTTALGTTYSGRNMAFGDDLRNIMSRLSRRLGHDVDLFQGLQ